MIFAFTLSTSCWDSTLCFLCNVVRLTPRLLLPAKCWGGGGGVRSLLASSCCCPPLPCCCHRSSPTSSNPRLLHSAQQFVWDRFPELLPPLLTRFDSTRSVWRCSNKERTAAVRSAQRRAVPAGAAAAVGARSGAMSLRTQSTARAECCAAPGLWGSSSSWNSRGGSEPSAPGGAGTFVQTLTFLCLVNN